MVSLLLPSLEAIPCMVLAGFLSPSSPSTGSIGIFQEQASRNLACPGNMVVFHILTWNMPGLSPGKALLAYAQTMPGEHIPALLGRLGGHTCPNLTFSFWKQNSQLGARWKAPTVYRL